MDSHREENKTTTQRKTDLRRTHFSPSDPRIYVNTELEQRRVARTAKRKQWASPLLRQTNQRRHDILNNFTPQVSVTLNIHFANAPTGAAKRRTLLLRDMAKKLSFVTLCCRPL